MRRILNTFLILPLLSVSTILKANSEPVDSQSRFTSHRPNFALARVDSLGESEGGEHIEYNFSTRYKIATANKWDVHLAYTGRFDFFLGSRSSSPIVNRLNNPELLLRRWDFSKDGINDYIQIGYGHESNGQQINSQELFDSDTRSNRNDFISRGWDYISVEKKYSRYWGQDNDKCKLSFSCTEFWFTFKGILSDGLLQGDIEDAIFISDRSVDDDIRNYDGLQAVISHEWGRSEKIFEELEVSLKLITGSKVPFENITSELQLRGTTKELPILNLRLPLYFIYRSGFIEEIADYSLRTNFVGFGLKFRV